MGLPPSVGGLGMSHGPVAVIFAVPIVLDVDCLSVSKVDLSVSKVDFPVGQRRRQLFGAPGDALAKAPEV
jgi:hypothetical protein